MDSVGIRGIVLGNSIRQIKDNAISFGQVSGVKKSGDFQGAEYYKNDKGYACEGHQTVAHSTLLPCQIYFAEANILDKKEEMEILRCY